VSENKLFSHDQICSPNEFTFLYFLSSSDSSGIPSNLSPHNGQFSLRALYIASHAAGGASWQP